MERADEGKRFVQPLRDVRNKSTTVGEREEGELDGLSAFQTDGNVAEEKVRLSTLKHSDSAREGGVVYGSSGGSLDSFR